MWVSIAELKLKKTRIKTLHVFKMLYTGYSMKETISMFLSRSTWNFQNDFFLGKMGEERKIKTNKTRKMTFFALKVLWRELLERSSAMTDLLEFPK